MQTSESIKNIAAALLKFDEAVSKIAKGEENPFFKNKYAALPNILDAIKQPLIDAGLTVKQFPEGDHQLTTLIVHAASGEYMESTYTMHPAKNDPQGEGSRITYQRRYALGAVLGLNIDEDDDGNKASQPAKQQPAKQDQNVQGLTGKPVMNDKILSVMIERAKNGEDGIFEKMISHYHVNDEQIATFQTAINSK